MLDIKFIRENQKKIVQAAADKRFTIHMDDLLETDGQLKQVKVKLEELQSQRNSISKTIAKASPEDRAALKEQVSAIKPELEQLKQEADGLEAKLLEYMLELPAPARDDVPVGKDDADNVEVKKWGAQPVFDFKSRDHMEIGLAQDWIDVERGVKLAGSRSYFLKGDAARLETALMNYTLHLLRKKITSSYRSLS